MKPISDKQTTPFQGGCVTAIDKVLLAPGSFSMIQNMRASHPGFKARKGQRKLHATADGTNGVMSLYQFSKQLVSDMHFFAQMTDSDVLEATTDPPGITPGAFGSEVFSGSASPVPASWAVLGDILYFSNGVDPVQVYGGSGSYVEKFIVVKASAAHPPIVEEGEDYTEEVTDGLTTTAAILDSIDTYANHDAVYVCCKIPFNALTFVVKATNGNTATMAPYYRKSDHSWAAGSDSSDGTSTGGVTIAKGGTLSWTQPTDEVPCLMFGRSGYWVQLRFSAALDAEVEISSVTWASDWNDAINLWNGIPQDLIEAWVEKPAGDPEWETYGGNAVSIDLLPAGDKILLFCTDPIEAIYVDVGNTPNATGTSITSIKGWTGSAFSAVSSVSDRSGGFSHSGWITFQRLTTVQPVQYKGSLYYAYIYEIVLSAVLSDDMIVGFQVMPYFEDNEFGNGYCNCTWKDRMVYSYDRWGAYIYVSAPYHGLILNGSEFGILKAGDGRANQVAAMRKFHNELMVWQEEKGTEGGCLTLFEGYSPTTFGKLLLSSRVGSFSDKSVDVVDGVLVKRGDSEQMRTLAFFLSHYGVFACDGRTVYRISNDIKNYFDPEEDECIRRGYEKEMWLKYDSAHHILKIGLVSGSTATKPNVFPVFDLEHTCWYFDVLGQELLCCQEVEAASGDAHLVQVGGGVDDGFVYQLNYGNNDVLEPIDSYVTQEFSGGGYYLEMREYLFRVKTQPTGSILMTVYANDITKINRKVLSQAAEVLGQRVRRHLIPMAITDQHLSVKLQHNTVSQSFELFDWAVVLKQWESR